MQWTRDYTPEPGRQQLYQRAIAITLVGNITLVIGKGIAAYLSKSVALYADAANSASDVLYSIMMVLGLWVAQRPPDLSHPQGHSRFEPLVGLMVATSMTYAGFEAARASVERFIAGGLGVDPGLPTVALLASAAIKAGMYFAIARIAKSLSSPTLAVTAVDNLSDVLTSIAALVGVIGSQAFTLLDPAAGLLVAAWIFRAALGAWRENLGYLTGAGASPDLRNQIALVAGKVPGVLGMHQVIAEYVGPQLVADLHIDVDGNLSLIQAHAIGDTVQARLEEMAEIDRAYVHIDPVE